jgi:hypothetical protein
MTTTLAMTLMASGWLVLLTVTSASATDRIWFKATHDYIEVDSYREHDGMIYYPRYGGEIAVAKSEVLKIEHVTTDPSVEVLAAPKATPRAAGSPTDPALRGQAELARLAEVVAKESAELSAIMERRGQQIEELARQLMAVQTHRDRTQAENEAAGTVVPIYRERIADQKRRVEDAERRYKDLESKLRAGQ